MMRYGSNCSGIEAATVAWQALGWEAAYLSEIDKFPRAVLRHHYPNIPLHGDFTTIKGDEYGPIDLLVAGTPCQDFSIAGLRAGIAGDRGNLTLQFLRLAARTRARWIVWENVPGVLSSDGGRALGAFLGGLAELGYGFAYRVLDAQHFGLAQRRARVFVVGHLGDWRRAAAVLFERESLLGHPPPRREAGEGIARPITPGSPGGSGYRNDADTADNLIAGTLDAGGGGADENDAKDGRLLVMAHEAPILASAFKPSHFTRGKDGAPSDVTPPLSADADKGDQDTVIMAHAFDGRQSDVIQYGDKTGPLDTDGHSMAIAFSMKDHGADAGPLSPTLRAGGFDKSHANGGVMPAVVWSIMPQNSGKDYKARAVDVAQPVMAGGPVGGNQGGDYIQSAMQVRRLTPRECERLQGFPDDYTLIPWRGGMAPDGPRYKALGNSMAVPVMRWIGERIAMVEGMK